MIDTNAVRGTVPTASTSDQRSAQTLALCDALDVATRERDEWLMARGVALLDRDRAMRERDAAVAENASLRVDLRAALLRLSHAQAREDAARSLLRECAQWVLVPLPEALIARVRAFLERP